MRCRPRGVSRGCHTGSNHSLYSLWQAGRQAGRQGCRLEGGWRPPTHLLECFTMAFPTALIQSSFSCTGNAMARGTQLWGVYTHTHTQARHKHMHTHTHTRRGAHIHTHTHTEARTHSHTHAEACTHAHTGALQAHILCPCLR